MQRLTSRQNPIVARFRAAARGAGPELLLDGEHLVRDALRAKVQLHHVVAASDADADPDLRELLDLVERAGLPVSLASAPVIAAVSPVRSPSRIVALAQRPEASAERLYDGNPALVVVACDVQDPGNIGAIVRVAEAGGASGAIAAGISADPYGWKALRGSMGSALRLPLAGRTAIDAAIVHAREHGCRIVATVPRGGRPLFGAELTGPLAVMIGGEGGGLPADITATADERITVPMRPPVESLNAAVTAALVVYEIRRQQHVG